jgi:hypothetical protein
MQENLVKYLAGLCDSDGSFSFKFNPTKNGHRLHLLLHLTAAESIDKKGSFVKSLPELTGVGKVTSRKRNNWAIVNQWQVQSKSDLEELLSKMIKHMIIKASHWQALRDAYKNVEGKDLNEEDVNKLKTFSKNSRRNIKPLSPKFKPDWSWLAGYLDGDGSFMFKKHESGYGVKLSISAISHKKDRIAIDLLYKTFEGQLSERKDNCVEWKRNLGVDDRNFALHFLGKLVNHLQFKKHKVERMLAFLNEYKPKHPLIDLFPHSLQLEAEQVLGEEFIRLPKRKKTGYTNAFWQHANIIKHNKHNRKPDSFPMGEKEITRNFTDPKDFNSINNRGYYLRPRKTRHYVLNGQYVLSRKMYKGATYYPPTNWIIKTIEAFESWSEGGVQGCMNGYQLSPKVQKLVDDWFEKPIEAISESRGMVNRNGESAQEIASFYEGAIVRDISTTSSSVNVSESIKIDIEALKEHKEELTQSLKVLTKRRGGDGEALGGVKVKSNSTIPSKTYTNQSLTQEGIQQRIFEINRLLATSREQNNPTIPVFYKEAKTGRYVAQNAIIQGYHKSVRYAALRGCYEYDLEAAHQNLIVQLLDRDNINFPELNVLREYVSNKQATRDKLASELSTSVDTVKEILQALTYGAQLTSNKRQKIYESCQGDDELIERVLANSWLKQYASTFKLASHHLMGKNKQIKNAVGIKREILKKSEAMAHILQGYERLILDTLISNSEPNDVALLVHDCIVYYTPKSRDELTRIVKENTGFELEFSEKQY